MHELEEFLTTTVKAVNDADHALHNGDPEPRIALWTTHDPMTVFGALPVECTGSAECVALFRSLASRFTDGRRFDVEIVAADVVGQMAYTAAYEDSVASFDGGPTMHNRLRVTQIYRRESGGWRLVHRHGDHVPGFPRPVPTSEQAAERSA
jgi:ketosteroid isomerase-like protein